MTIDYSKLFHVALDGDECRIDIIRPGGGIQALVLTKYKHGIDSYWTEFKGLDPFFDMNLQVTFEAMPDIVRQHMKIRLEQRGFPLNGEIVPDMEVIGKLYWYVVEGTGNFEDGVDDMLRRDRSRPASQHDAELMRAGFDHPLRRAVVNGKEREVARRIKLVTREKHGTPLTARWESFGWKVVELDPEIWWAEVSKPVGRPRHHPEGTTAADRAKISNEELRKSGGARRTFALSKEALDALALIRSVGGDPNDTAAVERVLKDVARSINLSY